MSIPNSLSPCLGRRRTHDTGVAIINILFGNRGEWGWTQHAVDVPDNSAITLGDSSKNRSELFVSSQNFLTAPSLGLLNVDFPIPRQGDEGASPNEVVMLKSAPAKFDA